MPKRKHGRPKLPPEQVRDIRIEIRLSQAEVDKLKRVATGRLTTWMRNVLVAIAEAKGEEDRY